MISHSVPNHKIFAILLPGSGKTYTQLIKDNTGKIHELKDPRTGVIVKAKFRDALGYTIEEACKHDSFFLICFGMEAKPIIDHLVSKFTSSETCLHVVKFG